MEAAVIAALLDSSSSSDDFEEFQEIISSYKRNRDRRFLEDLEVINAWDERRKIPKVEDYFNTVKEYQPDVFQRHFRLHREALRKLLDILAPKYAQIMRNLHGGRETIDLEKRLLITLWTLANMDPFRSVADRFGVAQSTAHSIFCETCELISSEENTFIKWPSNYHAEAANFQLLRAISFPGIIGVIDGMDIPIQAPVEDKPSYYNRKGSNSVKMQGICDNRRKFNNVFVGFPGACHDAAMWKESPIYEELKNDANLKEDFHLLGDSAYPLEMFILKPYRDNGHLSQKQRNFNKVLCSYRVIIEQAFGLLKGQYRRLKHLNMVKISFIPKVVLACCVLHNFALEEGVQTEKVEADISGESINNSDIFQDEAGSAAQIKRNRICNLLDT